MPNCESCGQRWAWRIVVTNSLKLSNKTKCPHCGASQYLILKSRKLTAIFAYVPAFLIITLTLVLDLNGLGVFLLAITFMIAFLGLYPFMMKLSNEDPIPTYKMW